MKEFFSHNKIERDKKIGKKLNEKFPIWREKMRWGEIIDNFNRIFKIQ